MQAAGHLRGPVLHPARQPHPLQSLHCQVIAVIGVDALIDQGQLHIFQHRQGLNQVVLLENEADLLVADAGKLLVRQFLNVGAVQKVLSPGGDVQAAQHVHHGGLAGTGLSHHSHELSPFNVKGHAVQSADLALQALAVDLIYVPQCDQFRHGLNPRLPWSGSE